MEIRKHCKISYQVVEDYTDETLRQIIIVDGNQYVVNYLPRPCTNVSDLMAVFHNGIRFATFAKFLKTISAKSK